jgi:hypothetical protein
MLWAGLVADRWSAAEECLKAELDIAHPQGALDGALAQLAGQREVIRGYSPRISVLFLHPAQFARLIC